MTMIQKNSPLKIGIFYLLFIGLSLAAYFLIDHLGEAYFPVKNGNIVSDSPVHHSPIFHVLLALIVILASTKFVGIIFSYLNQPSVMGEVIGGILLGPSLFGKIAPSASSFIIFPDSLKLLGIIAQLGVIIYMFLVGLELDLKSLRRYGHATIAVSHASIAVPFLLGVVFSLWIYKDFAPVNVGFTSFSLFLGISMSITAFPVLARILANKKMTKTDMGSLALACAAIDDATAWCLLAIVVSIVKTDLSLAMVTIAGTLAFILVMFIVVKPVLNKFLTDLLSGNQISSLGFTLVCIGILTSALATEFIGIHAIFGAFLFGAIIAPQEDVERNLRSALEGITKTLLLPIYFAFTGMRTEIGLLNSWEDWGMCLVIILIATAGKFGGTYVSARFVGMKNKAAATLGILMNTRGLMELIVLNLGLELGILSPRLFAMMVIMAVVTTLITAPILDLLRAQES